MTTGCSLCGSSLTPVLVVFDDPDHYAVPGRERRVSASVLAALAELLTDA
jgi:hypothetical protein